MLLAGGLAGALALLEGAGLRLPPSPLFMLAVVFAAFRHGATAGLVVVAVMTVDQAFFLLPEAGWDALGEDARLRLTVTAASAILVAFLVDRLRRRAEAGARSEQANAMLRAQMEERRAAHARLAASEREARRLARLYSALSGSNQAIVHHDSAQDLLPAICRIATEVAGLRAAWIGMAAPEGGAMQVVAASGPAPGALDEWCAGIAGEQVCNDVAGAPAGGAWHEAALAAGIGAVAGLELRCDGAPVGRLCLAAGEADAFDEAMLRLVREIAGDVSFALETYRRNRARLAAEHEVRSLNLELERRVAERTTALVEANRELEAFSYSVSHDLRAPLRAIDGFSRLLEEDHGPALPAPAIDFIARIRAAVARMDGLIAAILDLSRVARQQLSIADVDLSAAAAQIAAELRAAAPQRQVTLRIAPGVVAPGDPALLRAALQNLLDNAWKYTRHTAQAVIAVDVEQTAEGPALCVRDNGAGFAMAGAGHLFEPFRRLHPESEFEGTGIGLATVRRIARRHGGRIWAQAAPGEGAAFFLALPGLRREPGAAVGS